MLGSRAIVAGLALLVTAGAGGLAAGPLFPHTADGPREAFPEGAEPPYYFWVGDEPAYVGKVVDRGERRDGGACHYDGGNATRHEHKGPLSAWSSSMTARQTNGCVHYIESIVVWPNDGAPPLPQDTRESLEALGVTISDHAPYRWW